MRWVYKIVCTVMAALSFNVAAMAQSLEYYAGHKRTGVDLMWFKNFKKPSGKPAAFLFFSRNRASVDYHNSPASFGSVNAVSFTVKKGLGIVAVASFINSGFTPKAGIQLYKQKNDLLFFGWLVTDLKSKGNIDLFGLFRYQPLIREPWRGFCQVELFPVYNPAGENWNLTERLRLGIKYDKFVFGLMTDLNQTGHTDFTTTENAGGFLRYEF